MLLFEFDIKTFGGWLKAARVAKGVSQLEMATAAGVSVPTLSKWENDKRNPSVPKMRLMLDHLEIAHDRRPAIHKLVPE